MAARKFLGALGLAVLGIALSSSEALAATAVTYTTGAGSVSSMSIAGEVDADLITVSVAGDTVTIADTGPGGITTADTDCQNVAGTVTCPLDPPDPTFFRLAFLSVSLNTGSDTFTNQNLDVEESIGGTGTDPKIVQGGPGESGINTGLGNDTINGGAGEDFLNPHSTFAAGGTDVMIGGPGSDTAVFNRVDGVNVSLDDVANDGFPGENDQLLEIERVFTGFGNDTVTGNDLPNIIDTSDGNDLLVGLGSGDLLSSGQGDDVVDGGLGRDEYHCGGGLDVALLDPSDIFDAECERRGATVASDSATVGKGRKLKVGVECPVDEGVACAGKLVLLSNDKKLTKGGAFDIAAGQAEKVKAKLTKKGLKKLDDAGGALLVMAEARTTEPAGVSVSAERLLVSG